MMPLKVTLKLHGMWIRYMETKMQFGKKARRFLQNTFSNRKIEWQRQSEFISALAEANDIPFDPGYFPKPKRLFKHGRLVWEQSQAAEYISRKIHEKMMRQEYIFKPWPAAWLPLSSVDIYIRHPWGFIPIKETPNLKTEEGKIWVFMFSSHTSQSQWIDLEEWSVRAICKDCMYKWEHYSLISQRNGFHNPDDIITIIRPDGIEEHALKCPECGGIRIYKDGHWLDKII